MQVVNCSHIVSLTYWKHHVEVRHYAKFGCELLSYRIFDILETSKHHFRNTDNSCELLSYRIFDILETSNLVCLDLQVLL